MKLPAHEFLDRQNIAYEALTFPTTTEKGAANVANALGYNERQMVKTLIFETKQGERVLVKVGGNQSAVSGHLKKTIGSRNIKLAAPDVVKETSGYAIGSIPPFHWQPEGFRSFLEASLMEEPVLGINGEGRVTPLMPGCQIVYTVKARDGSTVALDQVALSYDEQKQLGQERTPLAIDMAPVQPHSAQRKARTCESCHNNPKA